VRIQTFFIGGIPPLELLKSNRPTTFKNISQSTERAHLAHHLENQTMAESLHLSLAHGSESNPNLGQPQASRLHWTLNFLSLSATGTNYGAYIQSMPQQWGDMGLGLSNHEENQQRKE
jgi:hypothetical protein